MYNLNEQTDEWQVLNNGNIPIGIVHGTLEKHVKILTPVAVTSQDGTIICGLAFTNPAIQAVIAKSGKMAVTMKQLITHHRNIKIAGHPEDEQTHMERRDAIISRMEQILFDIENWNIK